MVDPDTYAKGMPYDELARVRKSGPVHYLDDPTMGIPYWLVTGRDEIDYISKNPALFSSAQRTALADEVTEEELDAQYGKTLAAVEQIDFAISYSQKFSQKLYPMTRFKLQFNKLLLESFRACSRHFYPQPKFGIVRVKS